MKRLNRALDKHKIIKNGPSTNESALIQAHQLMHPRPQPRGEEFREDLTKVVHQANRSEIPHVHRLVLFGKKHDIRDA